MKRREFLLGAAGFSVLPIAVSAKTTQVLGMYRRGIGDLVVTAFLDGFFNLPAQILAGVDEATQTRLLQEAFLSAGPVPTSVNAYLIETADRKILVDGGVGAVKGFGGVAAGLQASGVAPDQIDTIFCSHLHRDHVGAFMADDQRVFQNARFLVHGADVDFWTNEANFASADDRTKTFAAVATKAANVYAEVTERVEDQHALAPGVTTMHMPGHTPGHMGLMLSSGGEELLIWADIVHLGPVQFAQPGATVPFDIDPAAAAATRQRIFDMVVTDRLEIAGSHIDFPSFGFLEKAAEGVNFVPSRWDHTL